MVKITIESKEANLIHSIISILNEQDCYYTLEFTPTGAVINTKEFVIPILISDEYVGGYSYSPDGKVFIEYICNSNDEINRICTILNRWCSVYNKREALKKLKGSVISVTIMNEKIPMLKFLNINES